jgi:hypothetical protein
VNECFDLALNEFERIGKKVEIGQLRGTIFIHNVRFPVFLFMILNGVDRGATIHSGP